MPRTRMLSTVFGKTLHDQRRSLIWWAVGFVGTVLMYAAFWPTIRDNASIFTDYMNKLPEVMRNLIGSVSFTTPEGYLQMELFTFVAPILLLVYAISAGSRAIAGEEEVGSLDLLLSVPVTRRRVLLDKFCAMLVATMGLVCLMWLSVVACGPVFDLHPDLGNFTGASLLAFLLATTFGSIALAVGCISGNKSLAIGVPTGIALVTFLVNMFQPSVDWLDPFRWISPFYYYSGGDPMLNGVDVSHALVLAAISVVGLGVALWAFERRDLA
jgi:beta-exotoxin I transport system permease protein